MDIHANRNGASAPSHPARPFDPSEWLARFVAADCAPLAIQQEIAGSTERREAVTDHIAAATTREAFAC